MTTPAQQAVFDAYQAYAEAYRRVWGPEVNHWDKKAQDARYQRYLERKSELDAANDAAKRAREALIASGDPWPAALFSYDAWLKKNLHGPHNQTHQQLSNHPKSPSDANDLRSD